MPDNFVPDSFPAGVTAEALRAKIERKSAISHERGHFDPKFLVQVKCNFFMEIGRFAFLRPPCEGLRGNVRRSS